jgi:outer membrane biosynthesis protein TonB
MRIATLALGLLLAACSGPVVPDPAPVPVKVTKPAPDPKPAAKPKRVEPKPVKRAQPKPAPRRVDKPKARPVKPNEPASSGVRGYPCWVVRMYAAGKTPAELAEAGRQYKATPADRRAYLACMRGA